MIIRLINIKPADRELALKLADEFHADQTHGKRHMVGHWSAKNPDVIFGVWRGKNSVSVMGDYSDGSVI